MFYSIILTYFIVSMTKSAGKYKLDKFTDILKDIPPEKRQALFEIAKV
jgi:glycine cleavage system protein P-like pyridoxal-binding family